MAGILEFVQRFDCGQPLELSLFLFTRPHLISLLRAISRDRHTPGERGRRPWTSSGTTSEPTTALRSDIVVTPERESHLGAEFALILRRSQDSEVRGGHKNGLGFSEGHNRFLGSKGRQIHKELRIRCRQ